MAYTSLSCDITVFMAAETFSSSTVLTNFSARKTRAWAWKYNSTSENTKTSKQYNYTAALPHGIQYHTDFTCVWCYNSEIWDYTVLWNIVWYIWNNISYEQGTSVFWACSGDGKALLIRLCTSYLTMWHQYLCHVYTTQPLSIIPLCIVFLVL
jgi:hypothetical protein